MIGISSISTLGRNAFMLIVKINCLRELLSQYIADFYEFSSFIWFTKSINYFNCYPEFPGRLTHSNSKQIFYEFSLGAFKIAAAIMVAVFVYVEQFLVMRHETLQPISMLSRIDLKLRHPGGSLRLQHCDPPSKIISPCATFKSNETHWVGRWKK